MENPFKKKPRIPNADNLDERNVRIRVKHDMSSTVCPSRFGTFQGKTADQFLKEIDKPWWYHWYGRRPTNEEVEELIREITAENAARQER